MNRFKLSVMSVGCALLLGCGTSHADPAGVLNSARIHFTGKNGQDQPGGNNCSMDIGTYRKVVKMKDTPCKNDEAYFYRFENVPSATLITLDAEGDCREPDDIGDWQFILRSYMTPTNTEWERISDLRHKSKGDIVAPGVLYDSGKYRKGSIDGKLSCVVISP